KTVRAPRGLAQRACRHRHVTLSASFFSVALVCPLIALAVAGAVSRSTAVPARDSHAIGGGTSAIMTFHQGSALTVALSPDGKSIAMNFLGNLWTLPATGGEATRISDLLQDTAYPPWSQDGKTIA